MFKKFQIIVFAALFVLSACGNEKESADDERLKRLAYSQCSQRVLNEYRKNVWAVHTDVDYIKFAGSQAHNLCKHYLD